MFLAGTPKAQTTSAKLNKFKKVMHTQSTESRWKKIFANY